jgi:lysophospholipase L1-like esterase
MDRVSRIVVLLLAVMLLSLVASPVAAAATPPPLPASMAALGDSITRAYDVCCSYGDHPGQSWSTGYAWYDGITSHYERIKRAKPSIAGHAYNEAVTGAKMATAADQADSAVRHGATYVTILLGANDLCTSSPDTMTSEASFQTQFERAMATLAQEPSRRIFVSSIPNIHQLWELLHTNSVARTVWATAHICQSMLGTTRKPEERQLVVDREKKFNGILAEVCGRYADNCRWDGGATYNYQFSVSQVSPLDFFHPSLSGQAALARVTWEASWWPRT